MALSIAKKLENIQEYIKSKIGIDTDITNGVKLLGESGAGENMISLEPRENFYSNFINAFKEDSRFTSIVVNKVPYLSGADACFQRMPNLKSVKVDVGYFNNPTWAFADSTNLESVEIIGELRGSIAGLFYNTPSLTTLSISNMAGVTNVARAFDGCSNLTDESLNNVLASLITATSYTGTKTLATMSFNSISYPASRIQALSNYSAFVNAGWSIGY